MLKLVGFSHQDTLANVVFHYSHLYSVDNGATIEPLNPLNPNPKRDLRQVTLTLSLHSSLQPFVTGT